MTGHAPALSNVCERTLSQIALSLFKLFIEIGCHLKSQFISQAALGRMDSLYEFVGCCTP